MDDVVFGWVTKLMGILFVPVGWLIARIFKRLDAVEDDMKQARRENAAEIKDIQTQLRNVATKDDLRHEIDRLINLLRPSNQ